MDGPKLVKMANQIAAFFAVEPERAAAVEGVTNHLRRFWEPRMRREILRMLDAGPDHGMHELVVAALTSQRQRLEPTAK
jgi:formate dehydrogenase subunit delta